jgi:hypothetical protein
MCEWIDFNNAYIEIPYFSRIYTDEELKKLEEEKNKRIIETANNLLKHKANNKLNRKININKKKSIIHYIKSSINRYKKLIIDYAYFIHDFKKSTYTKIEREHVEELGRYKLKLIKKIKNEIEHLKKYIIDKEELAKEAFKPSRINYILSIDPEYEF